jgi:hypothetical protein
MDKSHCWPMIQPDSKSGRNCLEFVGDALGGALGGTAQSGTHWLVSIAAVLAAHFTAASALAQSSCSSDGQPAPIALVERFISADCDACWADPKTAKIKPRDLVVDWIVPSAKGEDAPLSAAASRDAPQRLQASGASAPLTSMDVRHKSAASRLYLRVARGVALGGYMGASIELKRPREAALPGQPLTAWLLLVETLPAGTEGTPVARNLVRNALILSWNMRNALSNSEHTAGNQGLFESRPMSIPSGANPDRLRVVGWVEDASGQVLAGAASVCVK